MDDVKIYVPYENNIEINDSWVFYNWKEVVPNETSIENGPFQHEGYYTKIPKGQSNYFVGFQMAVENFGTSLQDNVRLKTEIYLKETPNAQDSTLVFEQESEVIDLAPFEKDTLLINSEFSPTEWGIYEIKMEAVSNNTNDLPNLSNKSYYFEISDSVYSRVTETPTNRFKLYDIPGAGLDGDMIGSVFSIAEETEVKGIRWYFARQPEEYHDVILTGSLSVIPWIFKYDTINKDWNKIEISDRITSLTLNDTASWIYSPFTLENTVNYIQKGEYLVTLALFTGVDCYCPFYIGEDRSIKQPTGSTWVNYEGSWYIAKYNPMLQLIIGAEDWDTTGIFVNEQNPESDFSLSQNFPNPVSDVTQIRYKIDHTSIVNLEVNGFTGKKLLIINEGIKSAGNYTIDIDISTFVPGIYYYTLKAGNFTLTKKLVVVN